jgi:peptidyl-prolyl cis-trans isomerase C
MLSHKQTLVALILSLLALSRAFQYPASGQRTFVSRPQQPQHKPLHRVTYPSQVTSRGCQLFGGFMDDIGKFMKRFTTKATASHILIKGGAEAENKLEDLKVEIGDSPVKFAEAAAKYSECPSASSGGNLGEFGPGSMVKEFDEVVFSPSTPVGTIQGPVKTQFGYHLIYINDRTE